MTENQIKLQDSNQQQQQMQVVKRNGDTEKVDFNKILRRIEVICTKLNLNRISSFEIAKDTINGLHTGITTEEIDHYTANKCAERIQDDPQYDSLAAGLCVSRLHKVTSGNFMKVTETLFQNVDTQGSPNPLVTQEYYDFVCQHKTEIQNAINYKNDYNFEFFGFKTLERSYLLRVRQLTNSQDQNTTKSKNKKQIDDSKIMNKKYGSMVERPQDMFMRVAVFLNLNNLTNALETYKYMSDMKFIFGSPTLYNAGSKRPQMSSCYLLYMPDSLSGIADTITATMQISKWAGGIGISASDIRCKNSMIRGTNGNSDGIIKLMKVFNEIGRYVNQGGRRNGAIAMYLEPWHGDIFEFIELRKNNGVEEMRARDLFLALWIPDLFMKRVQTNGIWSLMCPDECPGLTGSFGDEFEKLYTSCEQQGKFRKQINAVDLWYHILSAQIETGTPYMLFKDHINRKSNQQNIGVIRSSNLCAEIVEYTDENTISVCNLSSICLQKFVKKDIDNNVYYDYDDLCNAARIVTRNLNRVIDINFYPVDEAKKSNLDNRPIGVGVQGLADVYCLFEVAFDSDEARLLNRKIFETIYYGCLVESCKLAKQFGPYKFFPNSPFSKGQLQYHLWGLTEKDLLMDYDWKSLINDILQYGTRNSLLTACMPTASTSQIMGSNECFEPFTMNLYTRSTLAGEYIIINKYLVEKLISLNLWNEDIKNEFKYDKGSLKNIKEIPDDIKNLFRTAFEMKTKPIVQQAIERGPFIDQTQSMNLFSEKPDYEMLTNAHFFSWKNGLKTGMYYLRSQPAVDPLEFGLDADIINNIKIKRGEIFVKMIQDNDDYSSDEEPDPRRISEIKTNKVKKTDNDSDEKPEPTTKPSGPKKPSHFTCDSCSS
jgi:ribonucleoside-diphosphate reductase alpha subunit